VRANLQSFPLESAIDRKRVRKPTLREKQQQAISYAFHSTLLSNPHVTIELVRRTAER
jgi:hypothetical protein